MNTPDYSLSANWYKRPDPVKAADTFYIYATEYIATSFQEGAPDYADMDNPEMLAGAANEYMGHASVFEEATNVFMPYYRQSGLRYAWEVSKKTNNADAAFSGMPYDDIAASLDYYFENCNGGRPFILAGHSQGSAMAKLLLKKYFKEHPDYYQRMVAAYLIGYSVTKEDLAENPHLKFAAGETDTGVVVSWNTELPENVEKNAHNIVVLPNAISINPLNWKLDETYAPASLNLGSLKANEETGQPEIGDLGADAQVNLARGVVVTHGKRDPLDESVAESLIQIFGSGSCHANDYTFYYNNIKENAVKRVAAYLANH